MPNGINTEMDPRKLPEGSFQTFHQATLQGGKISPRAGETTFTPTPNSDVEWKLGKIGTYELADPYDSVSKETLNCFVLRAGGEINVRLSDNSEEALVQAAPTMALSANGFIGAVAAIDTGDGIDVGASNTYAFSVKPSAVHPGEFGLSDTITVTNDFRFLRPAGAYLSLSQANAALGATATNSSLGSVATVRGYYAIGSGYYGLLIRESEKTVAGTWNAGNVVGLSAGPVTSITLATGETTGKATPLFTNTTWVSGNTTYCYRLEDTTGYYYQISTGGSSIRASGDSIWPPVALPVWGGPLDTQYLPETLEGSMLNVQTISVHKGCLFAGQGTKVRFSEAEQPYYFREKFALDAGDTVLAIVSRDEVAEVYTPSKVLYIVGNPPYFELRETGITEGPVAQRSIVRTDVGTFALFDDGIYLINGTTRRSLTKNVLSNYLAALNSASGVVAGASQGVYYMADTDGTALCYDWEYDEWFTKDFSAQPDGFLYVDAARGLIVRIGTDNYSVGTNTTVAVDWEAKWRAYGDGRQARVIPRLLIDADGEYLLEYEVEGDSEGVFPLEDSETVRLPCSRGRYWTFTLSGTNKPGELEIRGVRIG